MTPFHQVSGLSVVQRTGNLKRDRYLRTSSAQQADAVIAHIGSTTGLSRSFPLRPRRHAREDASRSARFRPDHADIEMHLSGSSDPPQLRRKPLLFEQASQSTTLRQTNLAPLRPRSTASGRGGSSRSPKPARRSTAASARPSQVVGRPVFSVTVLHRSGTRGSIP